MIRKFDKVRCCVVFFAFFGFDRNKTHFFFRLLSAQFTRAVLERKTKDLLSMY